MRILHVADLHRQHAWFDWVASNGPAFDALVIAGDLLDAFSGNPRDAQIAAVSDWLLRLRVPTVVCSGNHDDLGSSVWSHPDLAAGAHWLRSLRGRGNIVAVDGDMLEIAGVTLAVNGWGSVPNLRRSVDVLVTHAPPAGCFCAASHGQDFGDPSLYEPLSGRTPATWLLCGHVHQPQRHQSRWPTPDAPRLVLVPGVDEASEAPAHWGVDTAHGFAEHSTGEVAQSTFYPADDFPRVRDLPELERVPFRKWLYDTRCTRPYYSDFTRDENDWYYPCDYESWKKGLPPADEADLYFVEAKLDAIGVEAELRNAEGGGLTSAEFAAKLELESAETVRKYRLAGEIFAWETDQRNFRYPAWQIHRGKLLPGLKEVLAVFREKDLRPLSIVSFFVYPSEELGNKSPLTLLRERQVEEVLEYAKRHGDIGA